MSQSKIFVSIIVVGLIALAGVWFWRPATVPTETANESVIQSPYVGQETRGIKALSQADIEGLLAGAGTPFGGMAKPAELNGYPGPRHVLDAVEAGEFDLTTDQREQVEVLYSKMRSEAITLGTQIIDVEQALDNAFQNGTINEAFLKEKIAESTDLYAQLSSNLSI